MGQYKKFLKNSVALTIGKFSSKILSFLLVPLYTAILSTTEYGTFDLITTTVTLLTPFLTMEINEAVMRFALDKKKYSSKEVLSIGLLVVLAGIAIFAMFMPIMMCIDAISKYVLWIILFFTTSNIHLILTQYLKGIEEIRFYTFCGVLSTFLAILFNILFLVVFKMGITGYMLSYVLSNVLVSVIISVKIKLHTCLIFPTKIRKRVAKEMLQYSIPMVPNSLSWWVSNSSDKYMIAWMMSTSALGVYSVAYKIPSMLTIFTGIFTSSFQISAVEDFGSEKSKTFLGNMYVMFSSFNIALASVLIIFAKPLSGFLFQKEFFEAWIPTIVLILAYVFNFLSGILGTVYTSAKKTKYLLYSTLIGAGLNIVLNFTLIPLIGILGAAIATLVSYICVWAFRILTVKKIIKFKTGLLSSICSYLLVIAEIVFILSEVFYLEILAVLIAILVIVISIKKLISIEMFANKIEKIVKRGVKK